jgi:small subunit ribosomal protein S7
MARRKREYVKRVSGDPVYNNEVISKFINKIMYGGKKSNSQTIVYDALTMLSEKVGEEPLVAFEKVIKNVAPVMEVKSRRVGGSTYQVPIEVKQERARALAMNWIIINARAKKGKPMVEKLASELIDAYNKTGASMKKRDDTHKMAESNKAFAHFRW